MYDKPVSQQKSARARCRKLSQNEYRKIRLAVYIWKLSQMEIDPEIFRNSLFNHIQINSRIIPSEE